MYMVSAPVDLMSNDMLGKVKRYISIMVKKTEYTGQQPYNITINAEAETHACF